MSAPPAARDVGSDANSDLPPPIYAVSQPQILVAPLPDSASFFRGRSVQGEVFVKGLGEGGASGVKFLTAELHLTNHYPSLPTLELHDFDPQVIWPPVLPPDTAAAPILASSHFPPQHAFAISLPAFLPSPPSASSPSHPASAPALSSYSASASAPAPPLPGTLNLSSYDNGEVRWSLFVRLVTATGEVTEHVRIEGTPQDVPSGADSEAAAELPHEVEASLERDGGRMRLLMDDDAPRLGALLRLGVEVRAKGREKTGVAGLSAQPDAPATLRKLRRVRVELFRRVVLPLSSSTSSAGTSHRGGTATAGAGSDLGTASTSTTAEQPTQSGSGPKQKQHLTLLYTSGKSLRYPGSSAAHPPLRVLFTIPTVQLGLTAEQSYGEISMSTPYHMVSFFIRATVGFGDRAEAGGEPREWVLERDMRLRPKMWKEPAPRAGSIDGVGQGFGRRQDRLGEGLEGMEGMTDEGMAREAYRRKGRDMVGDMGTSRPGEAEAEGGGPPPFDQPGPSNYDLHALTMSDGDTNLERLVPPADHSAKTNGYGHEQRQGVVAQPDAGSDLPTFLESEAQMANGRVPLPSEPPTAPALVPADFDDIGAGAAFDRATWVGRRGSLGGELGTWVEYDGYETFSVQPPSVSASFGASGSMDPPHPDDEDVNTAVGPGMAARLGLGNPAGVGGLELMEQLGLGEGTRVIDLQDDLPPGIDEPSLPALPDFSAAAFRPRTASHPHPQLHAQLLQHSDHLQPPGAHGNLPPPLHDVSPPSFAASEAAQAAGGVASSVMSATRSGLSGMGGMNGTTATNGGIGAIGVEGGIAGVPGLLGGPAGAGSGGRARAAPASPQHVEEGRDAPPPGYEGLTGLSVPAGPPAYS